MKFPEYDSPLRSNIQELSEQIAKASAEKIDDLCREAFQKISFHVDEPTLIEALKQDASRYREAYNKGRETGYTERDEEIVRCKDCKMHNEWDVWDSTGYGRCIHLQRLVPPDWFCADGER